MSAEMEHAIKLAYGRSPSLSEEEFITIAKQLEPAALSASGGEVILTPDQLRVLLAEYHNHHF